MASDQRAASQVILAQPQSAGNNLSYARKNYCPILSWRKLPACGKQQDRKLEAYDTCSSNGA
jgi:hypothetical protein